MEDLLIYFLKAASVQALFLLVYHLCLKRETLFSFNRQFLLLGLAASFLIPLIQIPEYIEVVVPQQASQIMVLPGVEASTVTVQSNFNWTDIAALTYTVVSMFLLLKFLWELGSLISLMARHETVRFEGFNHVLLSGDMAPFSFFKNIFYNPNHFQETELQHIVHHEIAHGKMYHSLDILLCSIVNTILWFSPLSWWYSSAVRQNLEYMADARATASVPSRRSYQYTLLKVSGARICPVLTNQFNNSKIKKRIIMLQQSKSKRLRALKSLLLVPTIALFLWGFNTYEVYVPIETETPVSSVNSGDEIKVVIDKDTSDDELKKLKSDLADKGYDFSYTTVRNDDGEIIDISIDIASTGDSEKVVKSSTSFDNDGEPIEPITVVISEEGSFVFMGKDAQIHQIHGGEGKNVWVHSDDDDEITIDLDESDGKAVYIIKEKEVQDGKKKMKKRKKGKGSNKEVIKEEIKVEIKEDEDGKRVIKVNGEEVSEEEYKALKGKKMRIHQKGGHAMGKRMKVEIEEKDGKKVIKVDGKEVSEDEFKEMKSGSGEGTHVVKVKKMGDTEGDKNVIIIKSGDGEEMDFEDMEIMGSDEEGFSFVFLDSEEQKNQLFIVDGNESTAEAVKAIPTDRIATIEVLKGEKAEEEYGDKGKNGVVIIKTKEDE